MLPKCGAETTNYLKIYTYIYLCSFDFRYVKMCVLKSRAIIMCMYMFMRHKSVHNSLGNLSQRISRLIC